VKNAGRNWWKATMEERDKVVGRLIIKTAIQKMTSHDSD